MKIRVLMLVALLLALTASAASAATSGPPIADAYVNLNAPTTPNDNANLWARGDTTSCTSTYISYMKWDLTPLDPATAGQVNIKLRVNGSTGDLTNVQVSLYQVTDDNWTESVTYDTRPALGTLIQSVPAAGVTTGTVLTFNAPSLLQFIKDEAAGNNLASFALVATGNCTAGTAGVRFDSRQAATGGTAPQLNVATPTAVSVSTAAAAQSSWPLYAGLGAVALIVVAGVMMSRRRTA